MSASNGKDAVRLCEHIVRQAFGDVVCRIASTLLNRGRLPLPTISRLAGLHRQTVQAALILLFQHGLVLSTGASLKETGEEEGYEFCVEECLGRLRWGRILAVTEERLGRAAAEVVRQVLLFGSLKVPEINEATGGTQDAGRATTISNATINLVRGSYLEPTSKELHVLESEDIARRYAAKRRQVIRETGVSVLSAVMIENLTQASTYEIGEERAELRSIHRVLVKSPRQGQTKKKKPKQAAAGLAGSAAAEEFDYDLRKEIPLRVNYERFGVLLRDEMIVHSAGERWNEGAAIVIRAILEAALDESSRLSDTRTGRPVTVPDMVDRIPHKDYQTLMAGMHGATSKPVPEMVRQYLQILSGDDLVPGQGGSWLSKEGGSHPGYRVELEVVCRRISEGVLMQLVGERLGDKAVRVLGVVARAKQATETIVRDCAMVSLRDARILLSSLQKLSLVEPSEIPKGGPKTRPAAGQPALSFAEANHLWTVDLPRAFQILLSSTYKTLGNLLQREAEEIEKRKAVLAREERARGLGLGRERLGAKDEGELGVLDDVRRKVGVAVGRGEMVAFLLRDLPGRPGLVSGS